MSSSHPKKAVVTGASGFIGAELCRRLQADGFAVAGLCRRSSRALPSNVKRIEVDLLDRDGLTRALEQTRADAIYHLAGYTHATRDLEAITSALDSNLVPTINILTAAARVGCKRIVLAGSMEEPTPPGQPRSPYAASKAAGTMFAQMFNELYGTPVTVARIFMVYGRAQRDVRKIIPHTILSLLRGDELRCSSGRRQLDWIYIDDVAAGLAAMAEQPGIDGLTIDLGTGTLATVREVVENLVQLVDPTAKPHFGALPDRPGEHVTQADADRTEKLLGWRAATSLSDGLARTAQYYTEHQQRYHPTQRAGLSSALARCVPLLASPEFAEWATLATSAPV